MTATTLVTAPDQQQLRVVLMRESARWAAGTALANATLSDAWQQVHAVTTVQDPSSSCLQVQASGARAMVFLDDFFVGTNSTAS